MANVSAAGADARGKAELSDGGAHLVKIVAFVEGKVLEVSFGGLQQKPALARLSFFIGFSGRCDNDAIFSNWLQ